MGFRLRHIAGRTNRSHHLPSTHGFFYGAEPETTYWNWDIEPGVGFPFVVRCLHLLALKAPMESCHHVVVVVLEKISFSPKKNDIFLHSSLNSYGNGSSNKYDVIIVMAGLPAAATGRLL